MTTDGIAVNEIACELDHLTGAARVAADSGEQRDQERTLRAIVFSLEVLNEKLSEIGARLERGAA